MAAMSLLHGSEDSYESHSNEPKLFTQSELNDLVRYVVFPKDSWDVSESIFKEK